MRGAAPLLALALLLAPPLSMPAEAQEGPGWWNQQWPFRVVLGTVETLPIPAEMQALIGSGAEGTFSTTLAGYELDFAEALDRAGWPASARVSLDPGSIVVVPYRASNPGALPSEPVPVRALDPLTRVGSCDASATARCLILWDKVADAVQYGIYFAPAGWGVEPVTPAGDPPTIVGAQQGHEHWFFLEPYRDAGQVHILFNRPPGGLTEGNTLLAVQTFTGGGWSTVCRIPGTCDPCEGGDLRDCNVGPSIVRVFGNKVTLATAFTAGASHEPRSLVALGTRGDTGNSLRVFLPGGSWTADPSLYVWAKEGTCAGGCNVDVAGTRLSVTNVPKSVTLPARIGEPTSHTVVASDARAQIMAVVRGQGVVEVPRADTTGQIHQVPVDLSMTVAPTEPTTINLISVTTGEVIKEGLAVDPPHQVLSIATKHKVVRVESARPERAYTGSLDNPGRVHVPDEPGTAIVSPGSRLLLVAPAILKGRAAATLETTGPREALTNSPILSGGTARELLTAIEPGETGTTRVDVASGAYVGTLLVSENTQEAPLQAHALTFRYPAFLNAKSFDYAARVVALQVVPSSVFAGSGATVTFDVTLTNLARDTIGETPPVQVRLDASPVGRAAELDLEVSLGQLTLDLPGTPGAEGHVPLTLQVPDGLRDTVLRVLVNGTIVGEERIRVQDEARVSVRTIRDFELTFEDGSRQQVRTAAPGAPVELGLLARNTGTVPLDIRLALETLAGEGFAACVQATERGVCADEAVLQQVPPGSAARAVLRVTAPDTGDEARLDLTVRGEPVGSLTPVRTVDATILVNVPVAARLTIGEERLALAAGEVATVPLRITNEGIQAAANLTVGRVTGPLTAGFINPTTGGAVAALETLLGPRDTLRAVWDAQLRVRVNATARAGFTTEVPLQLTLDPGGGLPRFQLTATLPVTIIRELQPGGLDTTALLPGLPNPVQVPLEIPALSGGSVGLRVLAAPPRWNVTMPAEIAFDAQGAAVLPITLEPPEAAEPGAYAVTLSLLDPLGPGGELRLRSAVLRTGVAKLQTDPTLELALGNEVPLRLLVRNVGNEPLTGTVTAEDPPDGITATSGPFNDLDPRTSASVPLRVLATEPYAGTLTLVARDSGRDVGRTPLELRAEAAELSLTTLRAPERVEPGQPFRVTADVANAGNVTVRNLTVALQREGTTVAAATLERLPPATTVPVTIEWLPTERTGLDRLRVSIDPDGTLVQDRADDTRTLGAARDTPVPLGLLILATLLVAGPLRIWRVITRGERAVLLGGLLVAAAIGVFLVAPVVSLPRGAPSPETPQDVIDSDTDGVSDVAEVTLYGSSPENPDSDDDGMPDGWEALHARFNTQFRIWEPDPGRADADEDPDGDGLTNLQEYLTGTDFAERAAAGTLFETADPLAQETAGTPPRVLLAHPDLRQLMRNVTPALREVRAGADPHDPDTDADGFDDGWEALGGLDVRAADARDADCDLDGLTNAEEYTLGTYACVADSDDDGIPDAVEFEGVWTFQGQTLVFEPTDPALASTGGSGVPDGWLVAHGLDPHLAEHAHADPDGDDLSTLQEWTYSRDRFGRARALAGEGLRPLGADSDNDGLPDGWEVRVGLDPLDATDGRGDPDADGLENGFELQAGTDPTNPDTDGDGLRDGEEVLGWLITVNDEEVRVRSSPLVADSDGDGLTDEMERQGRNGTLTFPPTNPLSGDTDGDGLGDLLEVTPLPGGARLDPTRPDTDDDGLLDGEEWDLWKDRVARCRANPDYEARVRAGNRIIGAACDRLEPWGDLDGDGAVNILDPNADEPEDTAALSPAQIDGILDGREVHPPAKDGRPLPPTDPALPDTDGDGLPDGWEVEHTRYSLALGGWLLDPSNPDSDGDGVPDGDEDLETGCFGDPRAVGDGIPWTWANLTFPNRLELEHGTKPLECDTDLDGLPDGWEVLVSERATGIDLLLDPLGADSDGNGVNDGAETSPLPAFPGTFLPTDPACPAALAKVLCAWRWSTQAEPLADTLLANPEILQGLTDCPAVGRCAVVVALNLTLEVRYRTDPSSADTDGDGFPDAWELLHGLPPDDGGVPRPGDDPDNDGLTNREELRRGTDPFAADTDRGGNPDGVDLDPLNERDDTGDCDWDGIQDAQEALSGTTRPGNPDTDGDGLLDAEFVTDNCPSGPVIGVNVIAVPSRAGTFTLLGEKHYFPTDARAPTSWDTDSDGLPDGWEALNGLNPAQATSSADTDSDGISVLDEYRLGRPPWWDETRDGAWWFGSSPTVANTRDLDGDGLDDTLFDPEPLSPANDCTLPAGWDLPAGFSGPLCLGSAPPESARDGIVRALGQIAYAKILNATSDTRGAGTAQQDRVRITQVQVTQGSVDTGTNFTARVAACPLESGADTCADAAGRAPPVVGVYANARGVNLPPSPKADVLVCVFRLGADWTGTGTCALRAGERELPAGTPVVLVPTQHGSVRPGEAWQIRPGDIQAGRPIALTAWALPTRDAGKLLVDESGSRNAVIRTPTGAATIALPGGEPRLDRGQAGTVAVALVDLGGHPLPNRVLDVTWNGTRIPGIATGADGTAQIRISPVTTDDPVRLPLEVRFAGDGLVTGANTTLQIPVRVPSRLDAEAFGGTAPGTVPVVAHLVDQLGRPLADKPVRVEVRTPGAPQARQVTATTGPDGNATAGVPLDDATAPGQARVLVTFAGDDEHQPAAPWTGLVDVRVRPRLEIQAPSPAILTEGVSVQVRALLPNGARLQAPPGEALTATIRLGPLNRSADLARSPAGVGLLRFDPSPELPLGLAEATVTLEEGRFHEPARWNGTIQILTPVQAQIDPTTLGVGVTNLLHVTLRDPFGRGVPSVPVNATLLDHHGAATTGPQGVATASLAIPIEAPKGEHTLQLEIQPTDHSLALDTQFRVRLLLGTRFEAADRFEGSVEGLRIAARLLSALDEPRAQVPVRVEGFGVQDLLTASDGRIDVELLPSPGTPPGDHRVILRYAGDAEHAPTETVLNVTLLRPTRLELDVPPVVAQGSQLRITGDVTTLDGPARGRVLLSIANRTAEAELATDGTFTVQIQLPDDLVGIAQLVATYATQGGNAPATERVPIRVAHEVRLTVNQRTQPDGAVMLLATLQRASGEPLAGQAVRLALPGGAVTVLTDENGAARYLLAAGTVEPGAAVTARYAGSDEDLPAVTQLELVKAAPQAAGRNWIWAALVLVVLVEIALLWRAIRRLRVIEQVLAAVEELERRLVAGDEVRAAVLLAYHRIRRGLEVLGPREETWETHREYLVQSLGRTGVGTPDVRPFIELVDRAQYDPHPLGEPDRDEAVHRSQRLIRALLARIGGQRGVPA